jgi:hypothetical protein
MLGSKLSCDFEVHVTMHHDKFLINENQLDALISRIYSWNETPDNGQMNCPKHVEFYSKNKFEKLLHLVGFFISNFKYI